MNFICKYGWYRGIDFAPAVCRGFFMFLGKMIAIENKEEI